MRWCLHLPATAIQEQTASVAEDRLRFYIFHCLRVERTEILAGAIIRAFQIGGAKGGPRAWPEDVFRRDVVHINRNPEYGCEGNQVAG